MYHTLLSFAFLEREKNNGVCQVQTYVRDKRDTATFNGAYRSLMIRHVGVCLPCMYSNFCIQYLNARAKKASFRILPPAVAVNLNTLQSSGVRTSPHKPHHVKLFHFFTIFTNSTFVYPHIFYPSHFPSTHQFFLSFHALPFNVTPQLFTSSTL